MTVVREFHVAMLGAAEAGKTSLLSRLCGGAFNRKSGHQATNTDTPQVTSLEAVTSAGLLLFHFYDWAWAEQRKALDINVFNQHLGAGADGAVFMYSVTSKESKKDFEFFKDWYERASGFDKPWLIISNKNDQKKRQVADEEGKSLANKGNKRAYVPISLVDDTGVEDLMVTLARLMMNDLNLTVASTRVATEESMLWSANKRAALIESAHSDAAASNVDKTSRVLFMIPNSSIFEKFDQALAGSSFYGEQLYNLDGIEEQLVSMHLKADGGAGATDTPEAKHLLPVSFIVAPPSASEGMQTSLRALGTKYEVPCVISIPKNVLGDLLASGK